MDTQEDLYALLQVHPKATSDVIKKAYRALMLKNHPDKGGDEQLAQRLNTAYAILIDADKRLDYDRQRNEILVRRVAWERKQAEAARQAREEAELYKPPPEIRRMDGSYHLPILWGSHLVAADERGNRVLLLDEKGNVVWVYGKSPKEKLVKPRLAQFTPEGQILVLDSGQQRLLRMNLKKEITWAYEYPDQPSRRAQAQPRFFNQTPSGTVLLTDAGNRAIYEINDQQVVWEFTGRLSFHLKLNHLLVQPDLFVPVAAIALDNGHILVADQGNGRVYEINRKGKLTWVYPAKKQQTLDAVNFIWRLKNGNTWIGSDKIEEVNPQGDVVWTYQQVADADIKQAYPLPDGRFLLDFSHLVKRGINQELMMVNPAHKILFRHYYSQYRFI